MKRAMQVLRGAGFWDWFYVPLWVSIVPIVIFDESSTHGLFGGNVWGMILFLVYAASSGIYISKKPILRRRARVRGQLHGAGHERPQMGAHVAPADESIRGSRWRLRGEWVWDAPLLLLAVLVIGVAAAFYR